MQLKNKERIVLLEETPANNHGCRGFGVWIKVTSERTGIVIKEYSCAHQCHGEWHYYTVGQEVTLPEEFSSWDEAEEYTEYEGSFSSAGRTKLAPGEF